MAAVLDRKTEPREVKTTASPQCVFLQTFWGSMATGELVRCTWAPRRVAHNAEFHLPTAGTTAKEFPVTSPVWAIFSCYSVNIVYTTNSRVEHTTIGASRAFHGIHILLFLSVAVASVASRATKLKSVVGFENDAGRS